MNARLLRRSAGAALAAALAGCAGVEPPAPVSTADAVVHLLQDSVALTLDVAQPLGVTRTDRDGNPAPAPLRWRTGDRTVAVVDSTGVVTAVGLGRTWIEVSDTRSTDTAIVNTYLRFRSIQAGEDVTCALALGGQAACWGRNTYGSLGDGQHLDRLDPGLVDGLHRFSVLSLGSASACGLSTALYCWGYNGVGQLGDGTIAERSLPVRVADTLTLATIALGAGTTTCAFEPDTSALPVRGVLPSPNAAGRTLLCWGWNGFGQMLDGGGVNPHKPKRVDPGFAPASVATGGHHVCALDLAGAAWCWGRNGDGQLGDSTVTDRLAPVAVAGGHRFETLTAGVAHTCGLDAAGQAWCWGNNAFGQLGAAVAGGSSATPVLAAGGLTFQVVTTSAYHTCGLHGGEAWCWGDNSSFQLGRPGAGTQPAAVAGGFSFASISTGRRHTCGIASDGFAWCWGDNLHGELGAASAADGFSPVRVGAQY